MNEFNKSDSGWQCILYFLTSPTGVCAPASPRFSLAIPDMFRPRFLLEKKNRSYGVAYILSILTTTIDEQKKRALRDKDITPQQYDELEKIMQMKVSSSKKNFLGKRSPMMLLRFQFICWVQKRLQQQYIDTHVYNEAYSYIYGRSFFPSYLSIPSQAPSSPHVLLDVPFFLTTRHEKTDGSRKRSRWGGKN